MTTRDSFELPDDVLAASDAFGNRVRLAIIDFLVQSGPSTRGAIASALSVNLKTLQFHLAGLRSLGILRVRALQASTGDWHRQEYVLDRARLDVLVLALQEWSAPPQS
ncbi:hypothetical protein ASF48_09305 [Rathayibacter sp. Leaf299]|uniref:winged helix-turn-helix domain-containing protein n=1 Tax=unclassified Rathayibacter TaxID=2609250 RepID=UPI0006F26162|nr:MULTISPECIES: helix-turn-helix domain-containing protein [unclassified Rathayibacter]KQQ20777.1 hypothetical protein ASF48_09305 [Rathayibacter sp. Leaf299]